MSVVLKAEDISKQYRLGQVGTGTLSHDLKRFWYKARGKDDPYLKVGAENDRTTVDSSGYVWALKDINFEIAQGEMVGIIGKNGAGKSTLLKLLSRVTAPTTGQIKIKGRIAALLEVGTGFHPELTGRENIYLNGAILGMSRSEIKSKLDEIVDFSGCQKYIDTPVKRYSSGMIVRLGFAVAAHLEPEILIVDEVLAVGDAEFQDKCIGKMKAISGEGRTVLFVSHNMASMKALCKKGFLMEKGRMTNQGNMTEIIETYLAKTTKSSANGEIPADASTMNTGIAKYKSIQLHDSKNAAIERVNYMADLRFNMAIDCKSALKDVIIDLRINTRDGIELVHTMNKYGNTEKQPLTEGLNQISCIINNQLQPGNYSVTIGVHETNGVTLDFVENILDFSVMNIGEGENSGFTYDFKLGHVHFNSKWKVEN
ncbi:MAG: ATP-binding cassette domain-containing protein [Crocinitomix sp.]|nr:ATP-binding cassette domain-containing protein [Crocinitomix sp.]